jgi:signal transduction histidine kinase/CheY-like chemotaxis protein
MDSSEASGQTRSDAPLPRQPAQPGAARPGAPQPENSPLPEGSRPNDDSLVPSARSALGLARRLIDLGVSGVEEQLALRLRICNGVAAANGLVCLAVALQQAFERNSGLSIGLMFSAATWSCVPWANQRRYHRLARVSVVVLFLGNIVIYLGLLGNQSGLEAICFAVGLLGCFLFTLDDWLFWIAAIVLSSSVYFFADRALRGLFGPAPMLGMAPPVVSEVTTFLELGLVAYFFALESRRSFRALRRETRALEAARAEAQAAANAKSQFLATMSHELRTPLNGVIGMTQLLSLTRLDAEQREHLRTLAASAEYLMSLLDGVLDLNKLEAGRVELEQITFQLSAALDGVAGLLIDRAKQKNLKLSVQVEEDCKAWVFGDQRRLQQIILNLVGNGIKFTERGGVDIRLRRAVDRAGADPDGGPIGFEFSVEDTGIGMSEQELEQLFLPFRQANTSVARRFGGTGLGLAISRGLVDLMGGTLRCTSRLGGGSRFVVALAFEERPAPEQPAALPPSNRELRRQPLGLRVLLAEDNVVNQKVLSAFLKVLGCEYEVVGDGLQVLARLEQRPFDVILMDCQMPELDGVSATERIRKSGAAYATIPIVALTANVLDDERQRCHAAGMNGYLTKPLARARLHDELIRYVPRRSPRPSERFA